MRSRNSFTPERTLASECRSMWRNSTLLGSRIEDRAGLPRDMSLTMQYVVAPVTAMARAVSAPIPKEQPVMKEGFVHELALEAFVLDYLEDSGSGVTWARGFLCGAAYLEAMMDEEE
jgi:hypothetical protein